MVYVVRLHVERQFHRNCQETLGVNGFRVRTSSRRGVVEMPSSVIGRLLMLSCSETRGADWDDSARVCEARFEDFQPKLKEPPEPQFASMQARQRVVTIVH